MDLFREAAFSANVVICVSLWTEKMVHETIYHICPIELSFLYSLYRFHSDNIVSTFVLNFLIFTTL